MSYSVRISLVEVITETEILIKSVALLFFAEFTEKLCQIVGNKAVVVGEVLWSELRNFPTGEIAVHTVKKRGISAHFGRERIE